MSAESKESKAGEFKNVLSKGVEAFAGIGEKIKLEKEKDKGKPKLTRILAILMNSFGARNIDAKVAEYVRHALGAELGTIGAGGCLQIGKSAVCYNANHVLAIALSIAYLKVKEQ